MSDVIKALEAARANLPDDMKQAVRDHIAKWYDNDGAAYSANLIRSGKWDSDGMLQHAFTGAVAALASLKGGVAQEPVAWVNLDDLDNMLDDRTAEIQGVKSGWRRTPLYASPPPADDAGVAALNVERETIAQKAREWAAHYSPSSDGRNTFVMFAEWVEERAALSAKEQTT